MKTRNSLSVFVAFCFCAVLLVVSFTNIRGPSSAEAQLRISYLTTAFGGLIAVLAALMLLLRTVSGEGFRETTPLLLPLLGGVLIAGLQWAIAVTLGLLGLAVLVREMVGTPEERKGAKKQVDAAVNTKSTAGA